MNATQKAQKKYFSTRVQKPLRKEKVKKVVEIARRKEPTRGLSETGCVEYALDYFITTYAYFLKELEKK